MTDFFEASYLMSARSPTTQFRPSDPGLSAFWGGSSQEGAITDRQALTISAWWAGLTLICESIAMMDLNVFRRRDDGGWDLADDHPVNYMFSSSTNGWMIPAAFKSFGQACAIMDGNFVCEIVRNGRGQAVNLHHWLPANTYYGYSPDLNPMYGVIGNGVDTGVPVIYEANRRFNTQGLNPTWFPHTEVIHVKGFSLNGFLGAKTLDAARMNLTTSSIMERFQQRQFAKGRPTGFLTTSTHLTDDQLKELRREWKEIHETVDNAFSVGVLHGGIGWEGMGFTNDDSRLLENKASSVLDVSRWLRIPPHMLGDLTKATEVNIEHLFLEFVTTTLMPWIARWEQELNLKLFTPRERTRYRTFYNLASFFRADRKTMAEVEKADLASGKRTIDEVRLEGRLNPHPDGIGSHPLIMASQLDTLKNVINGVSALHGKGKETSTTSKA